MSHLIPRFFCSLFANVQVVFHYLDSRVDKHVLERQYLLRSHTRCPR